VGPYSQKSFVVVQITSCGRSWTTGIIFLRVYDLCSGGERVSLAAFDDRFALIGINRNVNWFRNEHSSAKSKLWVSRCTKLVVLRNENTFIGFSYWNSLEKKKKKNYKKIKKVIKDESPKYCSFSFWMIQFRQFIIHNSHQECNRALIIHWREDTFLLVQRKSFNERSTTRNAYRVDPYIISRNPDRKQV
jgi:hypothetical protein